MSKEMFFRVTSGEHLDKIVRLFEVNSQVEESWNRFYANWRSGVGPEFLQVQQIAEGYTGNWVPLGHLTVSIKHLRHVHKVVRFEDD